MRSPDVSHARRQRILVGLGVVQETAIKEGSSIRCAHAADLINDLSVALDEATDILRRLALRHDAPSLSEAYGHLTRDDAQRANRWLKIHHSNGDSK